MQERGCRDGGLGLMGTSSTPPLSGGLRVVSLPRDCLIYAARNTQTLTAQPSTRARDVTPSKIRANRKVCASTRAACTLTDDSTTVRSVNHEGLRVLRHRTAPHAQGVCVQHRTRTKNEFQLFDDTVWCSAARTDKAGNTSTQPHPHPCSNACLSLLRLGDDDPKACLTTLASAQWLLGWSGTKLKVRLRQAYATRPHHASNTPVEHCIHSSLFIT